MNTIILEENIIYVITGEKAKINPINEQVLWCYVEKLPAIPKNKKISLDKLTSETENGNASIVLVAKTEKDFELEKQQFKKEVLEVVQNHIDSLARKKGYDSGVSCVSYAGYENQFKSEAIIFGKWRSDVWQWLRDNENKGGISSMDEIINKLPKLNWNAN